MKTLAKAAFAAAGLIAALAAQTRADDYPTRPITWVVPYTPGGITDTGARVVAEELGKHLGQPVVVENRPGAGGIVGTEYVARADPDGYTLIYGTQGTMAASVSLRKNLRYDPIKDFIPIHGLASSSNIIVAYSGLPFKTIPELVDYAKAHPGELNFASAGVGTSTHLAMELFKTVAGIDGLHVPYKGSGPALNDLIAGRVDVMFDFAVSSGPHVEAGSLVALATNGPERNSLLTETPTLIEVGYPDATAGSWSMMEAPAGTPPEVIAKLTEAMAATMSSKSVSEYYAKFGSQLLMLEGDALMAYLVEETARWAEVIKAAGVEPQ